MFACIRKSPSCVIDVSYCERPKNNLSMSPSDIEALTARGISSSASNLGLTFSEGVPQPVLLTENMRGVDVNDIWNASRDAAAKLANAHKRDKEIYG